MSKRKRPRKQTRNGVESRGWRIAYLVLALIGLALAADLARLHFRVHTDPDYDSFCAVNEQVDCATVAQSEYAVFAGLPVAVWGILFYAALAWIAWVGLGRKRRTLSWPFGVLFWCSALAAVVGVGLFYLSHFVIESICLVCAGTYLVNVALFVVAWLELRRLAVSPIGALVAETQSIRKRSGTAVAFAVALVGLVAIVWSSVPSYWAVETLVGPDGVPVGRTFDDHPWIGAAKPAVTIIEYSDYQCPHCRRGHEDLRKLVKQHVDRLRLVHRHFPLDHNCNPTIQKPFHQFACEYSRLAFCADEQDKFWEANDFLYDKGRRTEHVTSSELALAIQLDSAILNACMSSGRPGRAVQKDLRSGMDKGIRGTPTFVLDGETYAGSIPDEVLDQALAP